MSDYLPAIDYSTKSFTDMSNDYISTPVLQLIMNMIIKSGAVIKRLVELALILYNLKNI